MKKLIGFLLILVLIVITPMESFALKKLGQAGLKFLGVCVGARAAAMGEAYTVISDDADAIFHNPAGIAQMEAGKFDITVSRTEWFADISYNAIGIAVNGGIWGNFGLSLIPTPDYGDIFGTVVSDNEQGYEETGPIDISAFAMGLAYGRKFTDKFMIGGHVKYAYQHLGSNPMLDEETDSMYTQVNELSTIAYDFGTIFYTGFKSLRFGMSVRNFSGAVKYEVYNFQLPLTFKLGIGIDVLDLFGEHQGQSFLVAIDASHPRDYTQRLQIGGEYSIGVLKLRAGYKFNYDEEGLCAGIGIGMSNIKLDYAYSAFGAFNLVNRVTLGVLF
ncbi:MAG: PorV/PorQ family protein [candidate division WOR-3 bacterium]|jgi:hypothetical protein